LIFEVKPYNIDKLEEFVNDVSNPTSPSYGKYMSLTEMDDFTANVEGTRAVRDHLIANGISDLHQSRNGDFIYATAEIAVWEQYFQTTFYRFKHKLQAKTHVFRALNYDLPTELIPHVTNIFNLMNLPVPLHSKKLKLDEKLQAPATSFGYTGVITPAVLNNYYNIFTNDANATTQAVYAVGGEFFSNTDLALSQSIFKIPPHPVDSTPYGGCNASICNNRNMTYSCGEGNLDTQYILGVAQGAKTTFSVDLSSDAFVSWITEQANSPNPPKVLSLSYASSEFFVSFVGIAQSFNTQAIKLSAIGVTIVAASGDYGAPGQLFGIVGESTCGYDQSFPASSPYVLAVGATSGPEWGKSEVVCSVLSKISNCSITSGGGFSILFPPPGYQSDAIKSYFNNVSPKPCGAVPKGRGIPDVSMAGFNFETYIGGKKYLIDGTSASTPVVAAMVSIVNSARIKAGRPTLGFLNPSLYYYNANALGFKYTSDVTQGDNRCFPDVTGATSGGCCGEGYFATKGWDPVTGFGSIRFQHFFNVYMSALQPVPTTQPSTLHPTAIKPTVAPVKSPHKQPTSIPSTWAPKPSFSPTIVCPIVLAPWQMVPTSKPSSTPSARPITAKPTLNPISRSPTRSPSKNPSAAPKAPVLAYPTRSPSRTPTGAPKASVPLRPTRSPSKTPIKK